MRKLLFLVVFLTILYPLAARADHRDSFVQVVCQPDLDYFSMRTFDIEDTTAWGNDENASQIKKKIQSSGLYSLDDFTKMPYHCDLQKQHIDVTLNYYSEYSEHCQSPAATFGIKLDGKEAYKFSTLGNECDGASHQVEFHRILSHHRDEILTLQDCATPEENNGIPQVSVQTGCTYLHPTSP